MDMNMDLDAFFGLEPEEAGEAETEGEREQEIAEPAQAEETEGENEQEAAEPAEHEEQADEMPPEQRHANAARRRAAELDGVRQAERARAQAEMDALVKSLGLKDPYNGNRAIETRAQYDAYKRAQDGKALERGLSAGTLTAEQFNEAVDARIREAGTPAPAEPAPDYREVERQFAEVQKFDPSVQSIDELMEGEKGAAYMEAVARTRSMLDAYKLVYFEELQARQAQAGKRDAANREQSKAHLGKTAARGAGAVEVTPAMREAYRVFDPEISDEEIRKYEAKDAKLRKP